MQSFQDLLRDLATITQNRIRIAQYSAEYNKTTYNQTTTPTEYQRQVLKLLPCTLPRTTQGPSTETRHFNLMLNPNNTKYDATNSRSSTG